jgi:hypothetical protein
MAWLTCTASFPAVGQRRGQRLEVGDIAPAPGQTLAARQHHGSAGLLRQAGGQRHGVGGRPKNGDPHALAIGRHLVGQQAHGLAPAQRLDHLAHARQRGGHGLHAGAVARGLHHLAQPGLARRAVQHGDGAMRSAPALGIAAWADNLEAAQVRRQKTQMPRPPPRRCSTQLAAHHAACRHLGAPSHSRGNSATMRPAWATAARTCANGTRQRALARKRRR